MNPSTPSPIESAPDWMRIPAGRVVWRRSPPKDAPASLYLAIGIFDGVHIGHQAVIESAVVRARHDAGLSAVLTFDPHPSRVLRPDQPTRLLMPPDLKTRVILGLGVDSVIWKTFDTQFAQLKAAEFIPFLKEILPPLKSIHVGENFRFGRGRLGDVSSMLMAAAEVGVDVFSVDRIRFNGEPVSSSRLRQALEAGEIEAVNRMLGYDYYAEGPVVDGRKLGRSIGFPTLNLAWAPELQPRLGVYAVRVSGSGGSHVPGVANYGLRPTIDSATDKPCLEVHVIGDTSWDVGDVLTVEWLHFLRPERRFESMESLKAQIATDRDDAARRLGAV